MSTVVKELLVKFNGDTKGLDAASSRASKAISAVQSSVKIAVTATAALATGFAVLAAKQAQLGDELGKSADRLGISTERLAAYHHAANLAGVSSDTFNNSIKFMFKNAVEAASGNAELSAAFKALGVDAKEFINLNPSQQFEMLAQRISEIENPAVRSAVAMKVFGRSGEEMLNLIKDGTDSLTIAADETSRFGLEISRVDAAQLEAANDAMLKIGEAAGGAARQFAVGLSPAISSTIENLLSGVDAAHAFRNAGESIGEFFTTSFDVIGNAIDEVNKQFLEFAEGFYRLQSEIQSMQPDWMQKALGVDPESARKSADKIMDEIDIIDRRIQNRNNGGSGSYIGRMYQTQTKTISGMSGSFPSKISAKDVSILSSLDVKGATEALKQHNKAAEEAKQAQIEYNNSVADSFISMKDQMISGGKVLDNFKKVALNAVNEILNNVIKLSLGGTLGSGGGGLFGDFASGIFDFGKNLLGFAKGGSFTVGGDGATDSGIVAFKATRGEQVTVTKPNQSVQGAAGGGVSIVQHITIGSSVSAAVRQEVAKMLPDIRRATVSGVEDARLRGVTN